jgi:hypothetical protein
MGRVINPESAAKERTNLQRSIVLALRELMSQQGVDTHTRDLTAFISLALVAIHDTIEASVAAWEKRGYWLKADRFQMEWSWAERLGSKLRAALLDEDWATVASVSAQVAEKVKQVEVPQRNKIGTPSEGAYARLLQTSRTGKE